MKYLVLLLTFFTISNPISFAQEFKGKVVSDSRTSKNRKDRLTHKSIKIETDCIFSKLVQIRRDLHENLELSGNVIRTQRIIIQYLLNLGLEVDTNVYGDGVVGILKGGRKGKSIAWRSEITHQHIMRKSLINL